MTRVDEATLLTAQAPDEGREPVIETDCKVLSELALGAALATRKGRTVTGVGIRPDAGGGCTLVLDLQVSA